MADIAPEDVDATLKMVRNRYSRGRKAYGWVTGPHTRPRHLGARLGASGLAKANEMAGMGLTDLPEPIAVAPNIEAPDPTLHERQAASEMNARANGMPD